LTAAIPQIENSIKHIIEQELTDKDTYREDIEIKSVKIAKVRILNPK